MATEFQKKQFEKIYPPGIENHYWNHSRNVHIKNILKKHCTKEHNILEIGCGSGVVVNYLIKNGFKCTGVELGSNPFNQEEQHLIYNTDAIDLSAEFRKSVQVILLLDVIEHIQNSEAFLESIKQAFPNVQHYLITVPARQEIWSNFDEFNQHFLRYNKPTLKKHTLCLNGSTVLLNYMYRLLYFSAILLKLLNKKRSTDLTAPKSGFARFIHKILSFYFIIENKFRFAGLFGTSLVQLIKIENK